MKVNRVNRKYLKTALFSFLFLFVFLPVLFVQANDAGDQFTDIQRQQLAALFDENQTGTTALAPYEIFLAEAPIPSRYLPSGFQSEFLDVNPKVAQEKPVSYGELLESYLDRIEVMIIDERDYVAAMVELDKVMTVAAENPRVRQLKSLLNFKVEEEFKRLDQLRGSETAKPKKDVKAVQENALYEVEQQLLEENAREIVSQLAEGTFVDRLKKKRNTSTEVQLLASELIKPAIDPVVEGVPLIERKVVEEKKSAEELHEVVEPGIDPNFVSSVPIGWTEESEAIAEKKEEVVVQEAMEQVEEVNVQEKAEEVEPVQVDEESVVEAVEAEEAKVVETVSAEEKIEEPVIEEVVGEGVEEKVKEEPTAILRELVNKVTSLIEREKPIDTSPSVIDFISSSPIGWVEQEVVEEKVEEVIVEEKVEEVVAEVEEVSVDENLDEVIEEVVEEALVEEEIVATDSDLPVVDEIEVIQTNTEVIEVEAIQDEEVVVESKEEEQQQVVEEVDVTEAQRVVAELARKFESEQVVAEEIVEEVVQEKVEVVEETVSTETTSFEEKLSDVLLTWLTQKLEQNADSIVPPISQKEVSFPVIEQEEAEKIVAEVFASTPEVESQIGAPELTSMIVEEVSKEGVAQPEAVQADSGEGLTEAVIDEVATEEVQVLVEEKVEEVAVEKIEVVADAVVDEVVTEEVGVLVEEKVEEAAVEKSEVVAEAVVDEVATEEGEVLVEEAAVEKSEVIAEAAVDEVVGEPVEKSTAILKELIAKVENAVAAITAKSNQLAAEKEERKVAEKEVKVIVQIESQAPVLSARKLLLKKKQK